MALTSGRQKAVAEVLNLMALCSQHIRVMDHLLAQADTEARLDLADDPIQLEALSAMERAAELAGNLDCEASCRQAMRLQKRVIASDFRIVAGQKIRGIVAPERERLVKLRARAQVLLRTLQGKPDFRKKRCETCRA